MSNISKKVSTIIDIYIPEGRWLNLVDKIDTTGEPTKRHMTAILFTICQELEDLEKTIADIRFQLEERKKPHAPHKS